MNGSPIYKGIPLHKEINEFVRTFAQSFNEGNIGGVDGRTCGWVWTLWWRSNYRNKIFTMRGEDGNPVDSAEFDADLVASYEKITAKTFLYHWIF